MRVWFINHYAGLPETVPATRPYDVARHLVRLGHDITIVACSFNHYTLKEERLRGLRLAGSQYRDGVRILWIRGTPYRGNGLARICNMFSFAILALIVGAGLRGRPDIVIGTTVHSLTPIAAFCLSRLRRARFWLDITDIWPDSLVDLNHVARNGIASRVIRILEHFALRRAEVVTSVIPDIAAYVRDQGFPTKQTVWVPNGIDVSRVASSNGTYVTNNPTFRIMYAGGFAPAHALDVILGAAERIQRIGRADIEFAMVGDGPEMRNVKALIAARKLDNVRLYGFVAKDRLYATLQTADAFVVSARNLSVYRYGISFNKLYDYMLVGRPVVFAVSSLNDPIRDAAAGVSVPGDDPEALAGAVLHLSTLSKSARAEIGKRAREFALLQFDYRKVARRLAKRFDRR